MDISLYMIIHMFISIALNIQKRKSKYSRSVIFITFFILSFLYLYI